MTLTLELPPALEERLQERAQQHGQSVAQYAAGVLERDTQQAGQDEPEQGLLEAQQRAWEAFSAMGSQITAPPLSDYAVSRAGIYDESGSYDESGDLRHALSG